MANIGLYFGSFNPIHNGHLIVAQYMVNNGPFDKIRFVVSPLNPFKNAEDFIEENKRLDMVKIAIENNENFECSAVEFDLPKPSYTCNTLEYFEEHEPENTFSILLGSDNLAQLHTWKNMDTIAKKYDFHVYQRRGSEWVKPAIEVQYKMYNAPFLDISATYIRQLMAEGKSIQYLVPENIKNMLFLS